MVFFLLLFLMFLCVEVVLFILNFIFKIEIVVNGFKIVLFLIIRGGFYKFVWWIFNNNLCYVE